MDFSWSVEDDERYERARSFAAERVEPLLARRGPSPHLLGEDLRACAGSGLLGLCVPRRYGGSGYGALATARVVEGFARGCADAGLVFAASAHLFACAMPIALHAGEPLRQELLPPLCRGELIGANAMTEPGAGSDAFALTTTAVRRGEAYELSGTKSFVTNAPIADCFVVYASTDPAQGHLGLTAFVVRRDDPGLTVEPHFDKTGLASAPVAAVRLDGCRVGPDRVLAAEGAGAVVFERSMAWERACLFAQYVGAMDRQLDAVVAFARERRQFGRPIGRHQAVAHRIADMAQRLEAARLLLYRACWLKDQGADAALATSLAKVAVSEAAVQSGLDAIQVFGGRGVMVAAGVERDVRDAIPATLLSGTSEIHRDLIARRLGL